MINKTLKMIGFTNGHGRQDVSLNASSIGILFCEIGLLSYLIFLSETYFLKIFNRKKRQKPLF
ncbi:hypothetical protein GCM10008929_10170 [Alkalibacterium psychrotolerans]